MRYQLSFSGLTAMVKKQQHVKVLNRMADTMTKNHFYLGGIGSHKLLTQ